MTHQKKSILCIDDEPGILKSLERCLMLAGYDVLLAGGGLEGLAALEMRQGRVDLVLVDQRMPEMAGDEFLRQARARYGDVIAVMLSGYADVGSLMHVITGGGIYRFVAKPWDNEELLTVIRSAMSIKRGGS